MIRRRPSPGASFAAWLATLVFWTAILLLWLGGLDAIAG